MLPPNGNGSGGVQSPCPNTPCFHTPTSQAKPDNDLQTTPDKGLTIPIPIRPYGKVRMLHTSHTTTLHSDHFHFATTMVIEGTRHGVDFSQAYLNFLLLVFLIATIMIVFLIATMIVILLIVFLIATRPLSFVPVESLVSSDHWTTITSKLALISVTQFFPLPGEHLAEEILTSQRSRLPRLCFKPAHRHLRVRRQRRRGRRGLGAGIMGGRLEDGSRRQHRGARFTTRME